MVRYSSMCKAFGRFGVLSSCFVNSFKAVPNYVHACMKDGSLAP